MQCLGASKFGAAPMKNSTKIPQNTKGEVPHDPATPPLGVYLRKIKTRILSHPGYVPCSVTYNSPDREATPSAHRRTSGGNRGYARVRAHTGYHSAIEKSAVLPSATT